MFFGLGECARACGRKDFGVYRCKCCGTCTWVAGFVIDVSAGLLGFYLLVMTLIVVVVARQNQLAHGGAETVQYLLDQVRAELSDIIRDMFGNNFVQALFRVADDRQRETILVALEPFLLDIACDRNGTYALQSIVDQVR